MKNFNSWLNENKVEEKKVIKENIGFSSPLANINKLSSDVKTPFKKYRNTIEGLKEKHVGDKSLSLKAHSNRAMLLNALAMIPYEDLEEFKNDWQFVKTHVVDMNSENINLKNNLEDNKESESELNVIKK